MTTPTRRRAASWYYRPTGVGFILVVDHHESADPGGSPGDRRESGRPSDRPGLTGTVVTTPTTALGRTVRSCSPRSVTCRNPPGTTTAGTCTTTVGTVRWPPVPRGTVRRERRLRMTSQSGNRAGTGRRCTRIPDTGTWTVLTNDGGVETSGTGTAATTTRRRWWVKSTGGTQARRTPGGRRTDLSRPVGDGRHRRTSVGGRRRLSSAKSFHSRTHRLTLPPPGPPTYRTYRDTPHTDNRVKCLLL